MSGPRVLVLDAGTSGFRASVYDTDGARVSASSRGWSATTPPELAPFGKAYDPDAMWSVVDEVAREALAGCDAASVRAIGVTGQRIACAFLDESGGTLYLGPNADVRALAGADLSDLDADAIYTAKGRFPPWMYAPARLRWFEAAQPETHAKIKSVVSLPGWLLARLGVEAHSVDATLAADLLMLDLDGSARAPIESRVADAAWPTIAAATASVGAPHRHACMRWGLDRAVVCAVGIADTQAALLGTDPSSDLLVAGGSAPLVRRLEAGRVDPTGRLWTSPTADGFMLEANLGEMGTMFAWLRALLDVPSFEALDDLAGEAAIGCRALSAHLGPRAMNLRDLNTGRPAAVLMPFGQTMGGAPAGRAELARAYLESCAFATRAGRGWLDEAEPRSARLTVVGGMSRSRRLAEILAGALDEPVWVGAPDATARGAATVAAVAAELFRDLETAAAAMSTPAKAVAPADADEYEDAFERWLEREEQLEEL